MNTNLVKQTEKKIKELIIAATEKAISDGALQSESLPVFSIETPKDKANGDFASNFAMQWAKTFRLPPRKIAEAVVARMETSSTDIDRIEIAGPGFVNLFLAQTWYSRVVHEIANDAAEYGRNDMGNHEKMMVEFVSANPTGPMHIGNARGGVLGDSLANLFEWCGYDVSREFYVNDAGNQMAVLANSLDVRYIQHFKGEDAAQFPEDGYHGDYVKDLAAEFASIHGEKYLSMPEETRRADLLKFALDKNIIKMKEDLARYKIHYDTWFLESSLHQSGYVTETISLLKQKGAIYEKEGALWFKATDYGCEKDEVMVKSNGFFTYYAVDLAYHRNKFEARGFQHVIDIFGADHHGHKVRFNAGLKALGINSDGLEIVLMQLVHLMENGEPVRISKRSGKFISLSNLLDEIDIDAARFFFNSRQPDTHLEFDLALAVRQDSENPLYYVQYAHARICSILSILENEGIHIPEDSDLLHLSTDEEKDLISFMAQFPDEIVFAANTYDPARITRYCVELATLFHKFYNACRVKCGDETLMGERMVLCNTVRIVIRNAFAVLNITAPDKM